MILSLPGMCTTSVVTAVLLSKTSTISYTTFAFSWASTTYSGSGILGTSHPSEKDAMVMCLYTEIATQDV